MANWWDGIELWVAGLAFIPQFVVVLAVTVPLAFGLAWLLDRGLAITLHLLGRDRRTGAGEATPDVETGGVT
ncbi:hypothetical protein FOS14_09490 [Skermania sp. ID1734]|nr:hypothetical protein FOS14_09490 [Skermania sp. ID1734]